jgi:hypothetical protein
MKRLGVQRTGQIIFKLKKMVRFLVSRWLKEIKTRQRTRKRNTIFCLINNRLSPQLSGFLHHLRPFHSSSPFLLMNGRTG